MFWSACYRHAIIEQPVHAAVACAVAVTLVVSKTTEAKKPGNIKKRVNAESGGRAIQ